MSDNLKRFEEIVRRTLKKVPPPAEEIPTFHPFDERNIHPEIVTVSRKLFDDGYYAQSTFEAFKYIDAEVQKLSAIADTGFSLMMNAFNEKGGAIQLTSLMNLSEIDEQRGYRYVFAGGMAAIRNPRGHVVNPVDPVQDCLDHLSFASMLLRRLENRLKPVP